MQRASSIFDYSHCLTIRMHSMINYKNKLKCIEKYHHRAFKCKRQNGGGGEIFEHLREMKNYFIVSRYRVTTA